MERERIIRQSWILGVPPSPGRYITLARRSWIVIGLYRTGSARPSIPASKMYQSGLEQDASLARVGSWYA